MKMMTSKKPCMLALGLMVFSECALCCASEDPAAKKCACDAAEAMANEYDRLNAQKGRKRS